MIIFYNITPIRVRPHHDISSYRFSTKIRLLTRLRLIDEEYLELELEFHDMYFVCKCKHIFFYWTTDINF